jgi:hypothetical protein
MTGHDHISDDDLPPHIAEPLRASETLSPVVAERVMDLVRAEDAARYPHVDARARLDRAEAGWWRRRSVQLSPAAALAWAAGLTAIASVGTLRAVALGRSVAPAPLAAVTQPARAETLHVVRFVFRARDARQVALVGDFNGWAKDATPLVATSEAGAWAVSVTVPKGRHEYAFIVDGERWSPDPFAARVADEFGTESSVVVVGAGLTGLDDSSRRGD